MVNETGAELNKVMLTVQRLAEDRQDSSEATRVLNGEIAKAKPNRTDTESWRLRRTLREEGFS